MNCSSCGKFRSPSDCKFCSKQSGVGAHHKRQLKKRSHHKKGGSFLDDIRNIGNTIAKPFEIVGQNPFDLGYRVGHDFLGPKLLGKGGKRK